MDPGDLTRRQSAKRSVVREALSRCDPNADAFTLAGGRLVGAKLVPKTSLAVDHRLTGELDGRRVRDDPVRPYI